MRITLTTLTIGLLYALVAVAISTINWEIGEVIYSFIMTFGFVLLPLIISVLVFHFLLKIYLWTRQRPALIFQILTFSFILNIFLFLIHLSDFFRHQTDPTYKHYKSFAEYFITNMLEGVITATSFSILIPLVDNFFKKKILNYETLREHKQT